MNPTPVQEIGRSLFGFETVVMALVFFFAIYGICCAWETVAAWVRRRSGGAR